MSAKHAKKGTRPANPAPAAAKPIATPASLPSATGDAAATATTPFSLWSDSADPRKRAIARCVLVGVWLYVAALWLLALDQTFAWGIF